MGLARRPAIANRLTRRSACDDVAEEEDFTTEAQRAPRSAGQDLLEGCPHLIAFRNSVSIRGSCLRMDEQREEPLEPPKKRASSGIPKKTSVPLW